MTNEKTVKRPGDPERGGGRTEKKKENGGAGAQWEMLGHSSTSSQKLRRPERVSLGQFPQNDQLWSADNCCHRKSTGTTRINVSNSLENATSLIYTTSDARAERTSSEQILTRPNTRRLLSIALTSSCKKSQPFLTADHLRNLKQALSYPVLLTLWSAGQKTCLAARGDVLEALMYMSSRRRSAIGGRNSRSGDVSTHFRLHFL